MKFTIRLVGAIWLSVLIVIGGFAFLQIREERERLLDDLKRRAVLVGEGLKEAIEPQVARGSTVGVERILKKFGRPTRGIAVYDRFAGLMVATPEVAKLLPPSLPEVTDAVATNAVSQGFRVVGARPAYVYAAPLTQDERPVGALAVFLDAEHLQAAGWDLWWRNALRVLALALVISLIALVLVRSSVTAPMAKMSEWTKALRAGRYVPPPEVPDTNVFGPLAREVAGLARSMQRARAAAEHEAALRLAGESVWTEERLKQFVNLRLGGRLLVVVSNREPVSRPDDWASSLGATRRFAGTVLDEIKNAEEPLVLIQDYHFAPLPALVKAERPDARVALFWHIPWPNFEAFAICPWQQELLAGMLGADLVGFHTQYYCNNFLETVDRTLETRIDWEHFAVTRGERVTAVKPFPISVAPEFVDDPPQRTREELRRELGISAEFLGVGVERVDYTKGLPERFRALRWFFERYPEYRERVVFVQLGAPSRTSIKRYAQLALEVAATVREVNQRLGTKGWRPIVYLSGHHEHREVWSYYRHADFCMVTSLHDGMNLVAKEFVSVRDDEDGVLILSRFAGASHELRDALIINPYDLAGTAEAIRTALEMPKEERHARMTRMRHVVSEHNIYRWAGLLLSELSRIPVETPGVKAS